MRQTRSSVAVALSEQSPQIRATCPYPVDRLGAGSSLGKEGLLRMKIKLQRYPFKSNDCASGRLLVTFFRSKIRSAHGVLSATDARIEQASPPFLETDLTACVKPANVVLDAQSCASAQLRMSGSVLGEMQGR